MFFRIKPAGGYRYVQIVQSVREGKKVRQQVLATLGRFDQMQQSGEYDRLMRSGLRHCQALNVIDAHAAGQTEAVAIRRIGADLVFSRLWQQCGIREVLESVLAERRFDFDIERAIYLTVLHRLFGGGSDRAAERWREDYLIGGTQGLELHHLYRAMGFLGEALDPQQTQQGTERYTKDLLEEGLFEKRRDLFSEVDLVFFDTTSLYFEGEAGESLGQYGYSKDHRPDLKQIVVGMALDVEGHPICCEMCPGNTADVTTLGALVERMRKRFGLRQITIVADRGMVSQKILEAFESHDPPVRYIVGVRMRKQKEVSDAVLTSRKRWIEVTEQRSKAKDPAPLKIKEVWVEQRRYIVCLNEEERRKDAHDREALVASLREQLRRGDKSLVGNKGYRRYLKVQGDDHFAIDQEQIKAEARYDGLWVLRTNTDFDAESVAHVYKNLLVVEDIFRTTKSILETRPIYHKRDATIRGHLFCSFLALVLKRHLEMRMTYSQLQAEWKEIIRGLNSLQEVETNFQGKAFLLRTQPNSAASCAIRAVGVALPPTLREIAR